jgi:hypothetical protein
MTSFEARFFCVTDNYIVWYIGCVGANTNYTAREIVSDQAYPLIEQMFDQLFINLSLNSCIPFTKNEKTQYRVFFDLDIESQTLIINLWVGDTEPKCEILSIKKVEPSDNTERKFTMKVPSYCFDLTRGAEFYSNNPKLFLMLLNRYLNECKQEHEELTNGNKYLRFILHRDNIYLPPYVYGHLRDINLCLPDHKKELVSCPKGYLPCEMCGLHKADFIFIKKSKWINKETFTQSDIIWGS